MYTISQYVRACIAEQPFLGDILALELGNNSSIARYIQDDVEKRNQGPVSLAAITMAIGRLENQQKRQTVGQDYLKDMRDITVRSNLAEIVFTNSDDGGELQSKLNGLIKKHRDFTFTFIQGVRESILIIPVKFLNEVTLVLPMAATPKTLTDLSLITIRLPEDSLEIPGVYYPILQALSHHNINFIEIISVATELSILFEEKEVSRAFAVIKSITAA